MIAQKICLRHYLDGVANDGLRIDESSHEKVHYEQSAILCLSQGPKDGKLVRLSLGSKQGSLLKR